MSLDSLTPKQREVVEFCVKNDMEPVRAVDEGLVSSTTLYAKWGVDNVRSWMDAYRQTLPPPPLTQEQVNARIVGMVPAALQTINTCIVTGQGNKVAVDLAKWVIKEAYTEPVEAKPKATTAGEKELVNVLRFVKK